MKQQTIEALKELLRTFILGLIPPIVSVIYLIRDGINLETGEFNIAWVIVVAVLVSNALTVLGTAIMSALDKWLHENNVETPLDLKSLDKFAKG